jgi:pimeloyl-ACP methyl ester carboxylesterase
MGQSVAGQSTSIQVTVTGNGNAVIFLPGFASDSSVWNTTVSKFSKMHQCHVMEYSGFGKVAPIEFPWLPSILEDLKTYVAVLNSKKLIVVGHSMGGTIATWLAAQPELKMTEIIVIDGLPATGALMMPNFSPENMVYDNAYNNQMLAMDAADFEQMAAGMATDPEHQKTIKENILNCDRKTYVYGYTDYLKLDARPLLKNISIPVTITGAGKLYGKEMALKTYKEPYANLTGYTLKINLDAKHFIMMDAPL